MKGKESVNVGRERERESLPEINIFRHVLYP